MEFTHIEQLHAAMHRRYPQARADIVLNQQEGLRYLHVAHDDQGPWVLSWEHGTYYWETGPRKGKRAGDNPEKTCDRIAEVLGLRVLEEQV